MRLADGARLLAENPLRGYPLPRTKNPRRPFTTFDRHKKLLAVADQVDRQRLFGAFLELIESLGWRKRQRRENGRLEHAEHGDGSADAEGEDHDSGRGEGATTPQEPHSKSEIRQERTHGKAFLLDSDDLEHPRPETVAFAPPDRCGSNERAGRHARIARRLPSLSQVPTPIGSATPLLELQ